MSAPVSQACKLSQLLARFGGCAEQNDFVVSGLQLDSRLVQPGDLFVALQGATTDGAYYVSEAAKRGALAVLVDAQRAESLPRELPIPVIEVSDLQQNLGAIAAEFYRHPSAAMTVIGVTGTNGKTSCCHFLAQVFSSLGKRSGIIGTTGYGQLEHLQGVSNTTPDAIAVQRMLAELRAEGVAIVAMEASSHGLDQHRVVGTEFDTAVFTNLSRDHLDYHGTMERYAAAKKELFLLPNLKRAVINANDGYGSQLITQLAKSLELCGYGMEANADVNATKVEVSAEGIRAALHTPWGDGILASSLLGRFNLSNLLAVLSASCLQGAALPDVLQAISKLNKVPGRMQAYRGAPGPLVVVDYAHTPDALQTALTAIADFPHRKIWCVFGCGGNRDRGKRDQMGTIAARLADEIILTNDNPRKEPEQEIVDDILSGIVVRKHVEIELDRAKAIKHAVMAANINDIVLVAGKGHETYQELSSSRIAFSDAEQVKQALLARQQVEKARAGGEHD